MDFSDAVNSILWGAPTVAALALGGLWLSAQCGFAQVRLFGYAIKRCLGRFFERGEGDGTSPLQAVCTALAGTIGTGNIAGVAAALTLGGPGAIFWMWVSAFIGMGMKYAEIYLAVRYRERRGGEYVGGPMYYIKNGLGERYSSLAVLFCAAGALASFGMGNMMQVGSVLTAAGGVPLPPVVLCAMIGLLIFLTCRDGASGRGRTAALVVPLMAAVYIAGAVAVIAVNVQRLPGAVREIFTCALSPRSALGGAAGSGVAGAISWGFRRGLFSNEAGVGSSPIAHASANVKSPGDQALMGIFEVFVDTVLICTLTALMLLTSGVPLFTGAVGGADLCAAALGTVFGGRASALFMAVCMALFAYSSVLGWSLYGERCVQFLWGDRGVRLYRPIFALAAIVPGITGYGNVIAISDALTFLMLASNMAALILLGRDLREENCYFFHNLRRER